MSRNLNPTAERLRQNTKQHTWLPSTCFFRHHRHKLFAFSLLFIIVFLLLPPLTRQEEGLDMEEDDDDDMSSSSSASEEFSQESFDPMFTSMLPSQPPSSASQISTFPPLLSPEPPPSLKQPPPARSRLPITGTGGGRLHLNNNQQQQKSSSSSHDPTVIVSTPLGKIRGRSYYINRTGEWVGGFLGIPYAQPPLHQLRFRPPLPLESLTNDENDILNATDFGAICIQPAEQKIWDVLYLKNNRATMRKRKLDNYNMSEDCLTLNIYVPLTAHMSVSSKSALPVFFFIHGGSYYMNAGRLYPGQILASAQNLVVVTFNYRLGPLGFLSTEDESAPGNYGLLDQSLALDWVHKNIVHFGGDPSKITLVGNSAGGASVLFQLFSSASTGKFVGVSVQSGCSGAPWAVQLSPKKHAEDLATKLGCPTMPTTDMVECIRKFSPETIMKKAKLEDGLSLAYATVIDGKYGGKFLMDHPEALIRSRSFHPVPVLTGFTKDEVTIWFTKFGPTTTMKDLRSFVQVDVVSLMESLQTVTQANMAAMIHSVTVQYLYRAGSKENDTFGKTGSISDFISDVGLKAPCIKEMNLLEKFNSKPVFLYEFIYNSVDDVKMNRQDWIGAYHESELQFIFGEAYLNYSNHLRSYDDKEMSDFMMGIWGNFARYGNPNPSFSGKGDKSGLKFTWTNYTEYNQDFAVLGLKSHMSKYFLTDRMLFWNFFFPIFRDYPFRFSPAPKPCDEWEIISRSWTFWALLLVTLASGFALSMLIMFRVKRKLFSRLRTNNNTTSASDRGTGGVVSNSGQTSNISSTGTANHHHHPHHNLHSPHHNNSKDSSITHNNRHSGTSTGGLISASRGSSGGGGTSSNSSSSSHLLHHHGGGGGGANGTRLLSTANSSSAGTNLPIEL